MAVGVGDGVFVGLGVVAREGRAVGDGVGVGDDVATVVPAVHAVNVSAIA